MTKPENCGTGFCSCIECVVDGLLAILEGVNTMSATTATNPHAKQVSMRVRRLIVMGTVNP